MKIKIWKVEYSVLAYEDEDIKISHLLRYIMWFASMFLCRRDELNVEYNYASAFADLDKISNDKYSSYLKFYTHIIKILNSCPFLHICNIWDEKENNFTSQSSYAYIQF